MARQEINIGAAPTGVGGDTPRSASIKINAMTQELFARQAQLGTAATQNVVTGSDDFTPGRVSMMGHAAGAPSPFRNSRPTTPTSCRVSVVCFSSAMGAPTCPIPMYRSCRLPTRAAISGKPRKPCWMSRFLPAADGAMGSGHRGAPKSIHRFFALGTAPGATPGELMGLSAAQTASPNKANTGLYSYYLHPDGVPGFGAIRCVPGVGP